MSRKKKRLKRSVRPRLESPTGRSASLLFWFRTLTFSYWIFLTLLLWLPNPRALLWDWEPSEGPRGYAHIITFSLLGLLIEFGRREKSVLFWAGILIGYTFLTEIVQEMLPIRSFEWGDVAQDITGSLIGLGIGVFLRRIFSTILNATRPTE